MKRNPPLFRIVLIPLFCMIILSSCRFNPADGLQWEADLLTPIAHSELSIRDLVQDSTLLQADASQLLSLVVRDTFASTNLVDLVELPDTNILITVKLDTLSLASDTIVQTITLADLARQLIENGDPTTGNLILDNHDNQVPFVPETNGISSAPIEIDASEFFEYAELDSGELVLTVENELPLDMNNVILRVANQNLPGPPIVADTFIVIESRKSVTETYDLAGKEIESQLLGQLENMDLSAGLFVTIDTNDYVRITLVAQNMQAKTATAIFPEQTLIDSLRERTYKFKGELADIALTKVVVKSGKILAETLSTIEDTILFAYSLPSAVNGSGEIPSVEIKLNPAPPEGISTQTAEAELGGFVLDLSQGGTTSNTLTEHMLVQLQYSGNVVTLDQTDSLYVNFGLTEIEPTYVEGYMGKDRFVFKGTEAINFFDNLDFDRLHFSQPSARIVFANSIGLNAQVELKELKSIHTSSGKEISLLGSSTISGPLNISGPTLPDTNGVVETVLDFDIDNSNIGSVINLLGSEIHYDLNVETNYDKQPNDLDNFATENSQFAAYLNFELPLEGEIGGFRLTDTVRLDLDRNTDLAGLNGGSLSLILENEFPLQLRVNARILDKDRKEILQLIDQQIVGAGEVDGTGRVSQSKESTLEIRLDQAELEELFELGAFLIMDYRLDTQPEGEAVKLYDDYHIQARLVGAFRYKLTN